MPFIYEIPDHFYRLFRSYNRETYIEALLRIHEEYQYNNYFLSKEMCLQVLSEQFSGKKISIMREEQESEEDMMESPAARILNWLLKTGWLERLEDYEQGVTNIIIPDYAAVMIDAFERLTNGEEEEAEIYIQNIYAILFSYGKDAKAGNTLLKTAAVNTKKLNKALQDMLHNMNRFFNSLLEKNTYGDLLREHLNGYVEEIVRKKYHILKTSDNFYQYKNDIKIWLGEIEQRARVDLRQLTEELKQIAECETEKVEEMKTVRYKKIEEKQEALLLIGEIRRGFSDIERRISNMDREHMKYVRATVTRMNYLMNADRDMKGLMIQLLNQISKGKEREGMLEAVAGKIHIEKMQVLSQQSLYRKRRERTLFTKELVPDEKQPELNREEVLRLNRLHTRFSKKEIEAFIEERIEEGKLEIKEGFVENQEDFEKLILAYDSSFRKDSPFYVKQLEREVKEDGYSYPAMIFYKRRKNRD